MSLPEDQPTGTVVVIDGISGAAIVIEGVTGSVEALNEAKGRLGD